VLILAVRDSSAAEAAYPLLDEITAYVVERHPYDVPNVTAIPILGESRLPRLDPRRSQT
jgi:hypothetical protein